MRMLVIFVVFVVGMSIASFFVKPAITAGVTIVGLAALYLFRAADEETI